MELAIIKHCQPDKASIESQPDLPILKLHICRVCGKGFPSGCALGGHMRIHGVQKDLDTEEEEDTFTTIDSGDRSEQYLSEPGAEPPKLTYALRTNGGCYRNHHSTFGSWKMIITSDHDITNQPSSDIINDDTKSKNKRPFMDQADFKPNSTITKDEEVAQSLVMLSRGNEQTYPLKELKPSSGSLYRVEAAIAEQARLQLPLMVPPISFRPMEEMRATPVKQPKVSGHRKLFECKTCNKVFTSHQALGGHRASHRKVKGCSSVNAAEESNKDPLFEISATNVTNETDNSKAIVLSEAASAEPGKKKMKIHECTICHRLFPTGQALGGHKRCHWLIQSNNQPAEQQVTNLDHPVVVAPALTGLTEPLNFFLDQPKKPLTVLQPTSSIHVSVPDLGLVTASACPRNQVVVDDEVDSNTVKNGRKRKLGDDKLVNLGPEDWLRVGIGSDMPAN